METFWSGGCTKLGPSRNHENARATNHRRIMCNTAAVVILGRPVYNSSMTAETSRNIYLKDLIIPDRGLAGTTRRMLPLSLWPVSSFRYRTVCLYPFSLVLFFFLIFLYTGSILAYKAVLSSPLIVSAWLKTLPVEFKKPVWFSLPRAGRGMLKEKHSGFEGHIQPWYYQQSKGKQV